MAGVEAIFGEGWLLGEVRLLLGDMMLLLSWAMLLLGGTRILSIRAWLFEKGEIRIIFVVMVLFISTGLL